MASSLIIIGSIANIIVVEAAARYGITISFREHARTGVPVTLLSLFRGALIDLSDVAGFDGKAGGFPLGETVLQASRLQSFYP